MNYLYMSYLASRPASHVILHHLHRLIIMHTWILIIYIIIQQAFHSPHLLAFYLSRAGIHACMQEVVMALIANGRRKPKVEEPAGPMKAIPSVSEPPPCTAKWSFDSGTSDSTTAAPGEHAAEGPNNQNSKLRKLWLHTAFDPAPGGGSDNGYICRYCRALLTSQNISVRKKVWRGVRFIQSVIIE